MGWNEKVEIESSTEYYYSSTEAARFKKLGFICSL